MFKRLVLPVAMVLLMVGCAAKPTPEALQAVSDAGTTYAQIADDPRVEEEAPFAKARAEKYLREAESYTEKRGKNEEMLYLSDLSVTWTQAAIAKTDAAEINDDLDMVLRAQEALVKEGAEVTNRGLLLHNWAIQFNIGSAELGVAETEKLDMLSNLLKDHPQVMLLVEGHADVTGLEAFNMTLSAKRSQMVMDYLIGTGISAGRLSGVGYGSALPEATNATVKGREVNRRVDFLLGHNVMPPVFVHEEVELMSVTPGEAEM